MDKEEYTELGLVDPATVPHGSPKPGMCDRWMEEHGRYCKMPIVPTAPHCLYHGGMDVIAARSAQEQRAIILEEFVPQALHRLALILKDPEEKSENIMRAAFGLLDRAGIGPVQGLAVNVSGEQRAPLELLSEALDRVAGALAEPDIVDADVIDGEVVSEEKP